MIEHELTRLRGKEAQAPQELVELLYPVLVALARQARFAAGRPASPGTHSLVHEVYLKLVRATGGWSDRSHFLAVAAKAMRHVLVDAARSRLAQKRAGVQVELRSADAIDEAMAQEVLAVDAALADLERFSPRLRRVVELRFFAELSNEEIAEMLGVSSRTVDRDWLKARLFIRRALDSSAG